jgi:8-oxo-dGTP diphosphatase
VAGATVCVIGSDGKVLLGLRSDNGTWAMPGGGSGEGSSFAETAEVKLREELGLEADEADLDAYASISRADNHIATFPNGDQTHYFGLWFELRWWRGDPAPDGEEMVDAGWFGPASPSEPLLGSTRLGLELHRAWEATGRFQAR